MALQPDYRYTTGAPGWGRTATADAAAFDAGLRAYMLRVFNWMASGLLLTGIVALWIGSSVEAQQLFWTVTRNAAGYRTIAPTLLGWAAMLSPLAFVLVLSFGINRLSTQAAQGLFWLFCACMGASLSNIFLRYTGTSIASTFFVTAGMFAATSAYGYTTGRDLTRMGSFMMMGLIGIILAGLVNIFVQSSAMAFVISVIGVVVFVGLTAYDTQRIKADYLQFAYAAGPDEAGKRSVMDALTLYLNFVNLFQLLLQFMGVQRND
jgi:FtsH-binding integral membrane protein